MLILSSYVVAEQSHCTFTLNFNRYDTNMRAVIQVRVEVRLCQCPVIGRGHSEKECEHKMPLSFGPSPGFWTATSHPSGWQPSKNFACMRLWLLPSLTHSDLSFSEHSVTASFTI